MLALADEITGRLRRISQLESRMTRLTSDEAALRPWQALDIPLELSTPARWPSSPERSRPRRMKRRWRGRSPSRRPSRRCSGSPPGASRSAFCS